MIPSKSKYNPLPVLQECTGKTNRKSRSATTTKPDPRARMIWAWSSPKPRKGRRMYLQDALNFVDSTTISSISILENIKSNPGWRRQSLFLPLRTSYKEPMANQICTDLSGSSPLFCSWWALLATFPTIFCLNSAILKFGNLISSNWNTSGMALALSILLASQSLRVSSSYSNFLTKTWNYPCQM